MSKQKLASHAGYAYLRGAARLIALFISIAAVCSIDTICVAYVYYVCRVVSLFWHGKVGILPWY